MPDPVARPEVERVRERIEAFDISPTFDAKGSYSTRKSAEWATLRDEILAYLRAVEGERDALRENADELRAMVGECHLMISRQTAEFQVRKEWESTTLPARFQKVMLAALTPTPEAVERVARTRVVNDGIRGECWYCMKPGHVYRHREGYNIAMCDACRDAGEPPTPEAVEGEQDGLANTLRYANEHIDRLEGCLGRVIHALDSARRIGDAEDIPEGSRYIQISDTLAREWSRQLAALRRA